MSLLPDTIGSPLSYSSLGRDLEAAHTSVKLWMQTLRRLFVVFDLPPWSRNLRRALRRERKWYFLDWSHVPNEGPRFEKLVASALWQACRSWTDAGHGTFELRYLRTIDRREIDFVVVEGGEPRAVLEAKLSDVDPAPMLRRRREILGSGVVGIQAVARPGIARRVDPGLWIVSADRLLAGL